jgi:hypothetical protein
MRYYFDDEAKITPMATSKTPLALFTYNRPDHTLVTLNALAHCERLADCNLVIYCDGPKTDAEEARTAHTRRVVKDWASQNGAQVVERSRNLGLARSVVSGVTEQCENSGRVIVVEDDLVVSPDFLDYMLQALDRYQDSTQVYQISGFMFPINLPEKPDAFFLPLTTTWGWATWQRAWRAFNWDAESALGKLADPRVSRSFDLDGSFPYTEMLRHRLEGRNDSWGILWWYAVFTLNGLVLHPRQSLVWNGGFDNSGIHSGAPSDTMQSPRVLFDQPRFGSSLLFPDEIAVDHVAFYRVKDYLKSRSRKRSGVMGKLRQLKGILITLNSNLNRNSGRGN